MNKPLLTIQIPSTPDREEVLENKLLWSIRKQCKDISEEVKIEYDKILLHFIVFTAREPLIGVMIGIDDKSMTIGEKREWLYNCDSLGDYVWQIDSDDDIAPNAIELILDAIKLEPDCITFQEHCMINGVHYRSRHSLEYGDWEGDGQKELADGFHFHRTPFMKSVIKTEIARSVPIPHIRWSEDHQWSQLIKPHLKTEIHIPKDLYYYQHESTNPTERYGLDK